MALDLTVLHVVQEGYEYTPHFTFFIDSHTALIFRILQQRVAYALAGEYLLLSHCVMLLTTHCCPAFIGYEYIITLHDEAFILLSRWRKTSWLYILNRYMLLFFVISACVPLTASVRLHLCSSIMRFKFTVDTEVRYHHCSDAPRSP